MTGKHARPPVPAGMARDMSVPPAGSPGHPTPSPRASSGPAGGTARTVPLLPAAAAAVAIARDRADDAWARVVQLRDDLIGTGGWSDEDELFWLALEAWRAESVAARAALDGCS